jgi:ATP-binding cassette subfamily B protein
LIRFKASAILAIFMTFLSTGLDHASPWIIKIIIDELNQGVYWADVLPLLYILIAITLVSAILLFWQRFLLIVASREAEFEIRQDLFKKLQEQPRVFFNKNSVGDIMSKSTNDMDNVRELIGPVVLHSFRMVFMLVYTTVLLFMLSPALAWVGLGFSLLMPFLSMKFMRFIYTGYRRIQESLSGLNSYVQESMSGITVIKSFGAETHFQNGFNHQSQKLKDTTRHIALWTSTIWPVVSLISGLGICAAILLGSWQVTENQISIGELSAAVLYLVRIQFPLVGLGWVASMIQRGRASLDRIISLHKEMDLNIKPEPPNLNHHVEFKSLELINLNFAYPDSPENLVLKNISFVLAKGKSLGIVGETGCGKTTLISILTGIYSPPESTLYLNGREFKSWPTSSWKGCFSLNPQDGFLFSDTIRWNIELGSDNLSPMDVKQAAQVSGLTKDLPAIPGGLDALLGERGINLSGGQKQRVGLARALVSEAPVLILDDTLSAVDTETEKEILSALKLHIKDLSSVIISHRYSSVLACDEILYLNQGTITERGSHTELLNLNGKYAETFRKQSIHKDLEAM